MLWLALLVSVTLALPMSGHGARIKDLAEVQGVSLAALGERDAACATFSEMENKFPDASPILSDRVARETKKAGC